MTFLISKIAKSRLAYIGRLFCKIHRRGIVLWFLFMNHSDFVLFYFFIFEKI